MQTATKPITYANINPVYAEYMAAHGVIDPDAMVAADKARSPSGGHMMHFIGWVSRKKREDAKPLPACPAAAWADGDIPDIRLPL